MRPDPRCPDCDGKVSATAEWCMHCGADFDRPVDRGAGAGRGDAGLFGSSDSDAERNGETANDRYGGGGGEVTKSRGAVADELGAVLSSDAPGDSESGTADQSASSTGYPTGDRDASPTPLSGAGLFRAVADHVVAYVGANESRREAVVVGVPAALWFVFGSAMGREFVAMLSVGLLAVYLYTRRTARATIAASAFGSAAVIATILVADAVGEAATGGESAVDGAVAGLVTWAPLLVVLLAVGAWFRAGGE